MPNDYGIIPEHPNNSADTVKQLAQQAGYEVTQSEGALVVRPHDVQGQLATAMNYRFPQFRNEGYHAIHGDDSARFTHNNGGRS